MGYGGKVEEQRRARELRARSWTLQEIADELGVSKGSVSVWVRDVEFEPRRRTGGHRPGRPHPLTLKKQAQLERCRQEAERFVGELSDRDWFVFGLALYLGEGFKTEESGIGLANTSPEVLVLFVTWLRRYFDIDESRLRVRLYLHEELDVGAATTFWSELLDIPVAQFTSPYRPVARGTFRRSKHVYGCPRVRYTDITLHRRVMAMIAAVTSSVDLPG